MKYEKLCFTGRMEPPHLGHIGAIKKGLETADQVVIVLGSARSPRTIKNPWDVGERIQMISMCFPNQLDRIKFASVRDSLYNDNLWLTNYHRAVDPYVGATDPKKIALLGHLKDESSLYLKKFPQWGFESSLVGQPILNATDVRSAYFEDRLDSIRKNLPDPIMDYLLDFKDKHFAFPELKSEYEFIKKYKEIWADAPYDVQFITADTVAICNGHVLLIERKGYPGRGLWALPGGYVNKNERIKTAAIRELKEETRIAISKDDLAKTYGAYFLADHQERSLRGRTVSHAWLADLDQIGFDLGQLPKVKGSDDAKKAFWFPVYEVLENSHMFFEDHCDIILHLTMGY